MRVMVDATHGLCFDPGHLVDAALLRDPRVLLEAPLNENLVEVRHLRVYRFCEGRLLAHEVGALQRLRLALALLVVVRDLTPAVRRDQTHLAAPARRLDHDALADL